jgi:hypothetical protein
MQFDKQFRPPSGNRPGARYTSCASEPCRSRKTSLSHALLMLVGILGAGGATGTANATQFSPPNMEGFSLYQEQDTDGDGDGVKETHIQQYLNASGDSIFSMTTNGHLWAWSLETKGESTSGLHNYVIRDSDCDGVFDEVYGLDDKYYLPGCVKK